MSSTDDMLTAKRSFWFATGRAANSSKQPVHVADVVVTLVDRSGTLLAAAATRVYPDAETIEPGASAAYETFFQTIPGVNMDDVTITTFVQGYVE